MAQLSLFERQGWRVFPFPGGDFRLHPAFLSPAEADPLFQSLHHDIPWRQDDITLFGKTHPVPRLHQWFGVEGQPYRWSGITMRSQRWPPALVDVRARLCAELGVPFNSVLANLYRDGQDSVGWHADDEPEFGPCPTIASLSLGATRPFALRHRTDPKHRHHLVDLSHGSLFVMGGESQRHWVHALPKRKGISEARINLTFRWTRS